MAAVCDHGAQGPAVLVPLYPIDRHVPGEHLAGQKLAGTRTPCLWLFWTVDASRSDPGSGVVRAEKDEGIRFNGADDLADAMGPQGNSREQEGSEGGERPCSHDDRRAALTSPSIAQSSPEW